jgi:hypothetical protein
MQPNADLAEHSARLHQVMLEQAPKLNGTKHHSVDSHISLISRQWPNPVGEEALHGLTGDIVRAIAPHSEADEAALLMQVLVAFGALVGRGPHVKVEGDEHHGNLYALLVGETAKARKGTSWGRVRELFSRVTDWPTNVEGLSSGEGVKFHVRCRQAATRRRKRVCPGVAANHSCR